ncbi:MAG: Crp/Fnr family transcriptional regulator [Deltaproteobacteria bacterium]|nr:Crp/Fnr family transcriptional regulator [Deltaproteobacteria bacterium]
MIEITQFKSIRMLSYLTDEMLEKIEPITTIVDYKAGEYIFREGEYAEYLYSILEGDVGLETEKHSSKRILVTKITRGMTLGFSSLLDTDYRKYLGFAKALTDTKLFAWKGVEMEKLFVRDYEMGFLIMRRIANIIHKRLQITMTQLVDIYQ